jgi:mono/diheme cytochrome c family protein
MCDASAPVVIVSREGDFPLREISHRCGYSRRCARGAALATRCLWRFLAGTPLAFSARMTVHRLSAVIALAFVVSGAHAAFAQDKAQIAHGEKVYADQKCAVCHSVAGKGNAKGPLDDVGSRLALEEIRMWIVSPADMIKKTNAARKPAMRAYPNLPKEDLDALVAYMASLKKK